MGDSRLRWIIVINTLLLALTRGYAQEPATSEKTGGWESKLWLSGQFNLVGQFYPSFHADYSGPYSIPSEGQAKPTWVATIYTGYALFKNTEVFLDVESAKGAGVSGALGFGGIENLDAVTDPHDSATPYIARLQVRQIIPLSKRMVSVDRNPLGLVAAVPDRRLELRVGKMSLTDFFDLNAVGSDSHLQFLNYAIDNNATYDAAANSRGYTYAALAELYYPSWTIRFAEAFEPKDPSGHRTDWDLSQSSSENLEFELHPNIRGQQPFTIRTLGFWNRAEMGSYQDAVTAYLSGQDPTPNLKAHISRDHNWGLGLNGEAMLPAGIRMFARLGGTDGKKEAYQFAEADRTIAFGGDLNGRAWKRRHDKAGVAAAINGLSAIHRTYLELGGTSYLLGDGALTYGREKVLEGYYNVPFWHGIYGAFDVQRIWNPGYNQARGPIIIFGLRLHLEGDVHFN
ncbi:MAG TPA: carbohydrate porin [Bryobacteraceae bacterium]|nr:carbohydrate porin [Bryobacteraceae bacterium]